MVAELIKVKIDEIELYLELLKKDNLIDLEATTCKEIAELIQNNFGVVCTQQDIFLLHEPLIAADRISLEVHYQVLGLI